MAMAGCLLALLAAGPARAHVEIVATPAVPGEEVRIAFQVGHGCGDSPTVALTVQVPEGLLLARPMVKPGWNISTQSRLLDPPFVRHGIAFTQSMALARWDGGSLPAALFDEFVIKGIVSETARGSLAFAVRQVCLDGQQYDWSGAADSAQPAPVLKIEHGHPRAR
jgi:uncharacterized protein YcnI